MNGHYYGLETRARLDIECGVRLGLNDDDDDDDDGVA